MTVSEASKATGYSVRIIRQMLRDGKIKGKRVGRRWEIDDINNVKKGNNYGNKGKVSKDSAGA